MIKKLVNKLSSVKDQLIGRTITSEEDTLLENKFSNEIFPKELLTILKQFNIIGQKFTLTEKDDKSELGVNMQWFTPKDQIEEAFNYYPGIAAITSGYVPIGQCLIGSGDPYFLSIKDKEWQVVRILHD